MSLASRRRLRAQQSSGKVALCAVQMPVVRVVPEPASLEDLAARLQETRTRGSHHVPDLTLGGSEIALPSLSSTPHER
jgi:hypothetical protein